jgi:type II secretory pathway pseudopilin PulG
MQPTQRQSQRQQQQRQQQQLQLQQQQQQRQQQQGQRIGSGTNRKVEGVSNPSHALSTLLQSLSNGGNISGADYWLAYDFLLKGSQFFPLDIDRPHLLPAGVHFAHVVGSVDGEEQFAWDKIVLAIQVSDHESITTVSASLSPDRRMVVVKMPTMER